MTASCPFCQVDADRVFYADSLVLGLWDRFPASPGHALLVPKRHVAGWFEATDEERAALTAAISEARDAVLQNHRPDGFNVGINIAAAGGQTVEHLHVHLIPRYAGDVEDPRGGVRGVIPAKANYLLEPTESVAGSGGASTPLPGDPPHVRYLITGEDDHLLPHLLAHMDSATAVDIAVAFVMPSGIDAISPRLAELLSRGGAVRLLTGDYLQITDPDALMKLLDLQQLGHPGKIDLRVFVTSGQSFHPKSYVFHGSPRDGSLAFVGSSNLSRSALTTGVEWNYRIVSSGQAQGFEEVRSAFEELFEHPATRELTQDWVDEYRQIRRQTLAAGTSPEAPAAEPGAYPPEPEHRGLMALAEHPEAPPEPHSVQREALDALQATRAAGYRAGLVVMATGLGKTWLSAFDSIGNEFRRVLFIAHREEILAQAMQTFRRIAPEAHLGRFTGSEKAPGADVVFASIQSLSRAPNLRVFDPSEFDYIVVDEFHHAAARTYRKVIDYFEPAFLLGLTATPERTDGGDLMALCQENLVYRRDVADAIRAGLLAPFKYFGVPDEIDYAQIPWRGRRFDEEALTQAAATLSRAENALEQYRKYGQTRTLAFCVSIRHAEFMAEYFRDQGLRAVAVHSEATSAPRTRSLEDLEAGHLDVIFAVDIFNEGVDVPHVDTVLMLRPTESRILWTQQFGRGLRIQEGKSHLSVIDYIGNHRSFLLKPQTLLGLGGSDREVSLALKQLEAGELELPPGCEITYELEAKNILRSLLREPRGEEQLRVFCESFRELHDIRPTASEVLHEGYNPRAARKASGSWFGFLAGIELLSPAETQGFASAREFLELLEITPMTKSYKMLLLLALLRRDALPGGLHIDALTSEVQKLARRSSVLTADLSVDVDDAAAVRQLLEKNPIEALVGAKGMGGGSYFQYDGNTFSSSLPVDEETREHFQDLARELVDWRLAEYLLRPRPAGDNIGFTCRLFHAGKNPILSLPDRETVSGVPSGWADVDVDGAPIALNFVKIAVNVAHKPGSDDNVLPEILRKWFGANAGQPGTHHQVRFESTESGLLMRPVVTDQPLWKTYARNEIPQLFGLDFQEYRWRAGYVFLPGHIFLLVTLDKSDMEDRYSYKDRFLSPNVFQWQSQNRTIQGGADGQRISKHASQGIDVHLFVRRTRKVEGRAARYYYCGDVDFVDWEGEKPITVRWKLREAVPPGLDEMFGVSRTSGQSDG